MKNFLLISLVALFCAASCSGGNPPAAPTAVAPAPAPTPSPNTPPGFTVGANFFVIEHQVVIGDIDASDPDGDPVTLSIGGRDGTAFSLRGNQIVAAIDLDFETPRDVGGNNFYLISITASDGIDSVTLDNISIEVTDIPNDGIIKIIGAQATDGIGQTIIAAPDLNGGGVDDVFFTKYVRPFPGTTLDSVAHIVYGESLVGEINRTIDFASFSNNEASTVLNSFFSSSTTQNSLTLAFQGTAPGMPTLHANYVGSNAGRAYALFADERVGAPLLPGSFDPFDLSTPLDGVRPLTHPTFSSVIPVGDLNGDGVTDARTQLGVVDGSAIRNSANGLFDPSGALTIEFTVLNLGAGRNPFLFSGDPAGDIDGNGKDDLPFLFPLVDSSGPSPVTIGEIQKFVVGDIFDLSVSSTLDVTALAFPNAYTLNITTFESPRIASPADIDSDGFDDVLFGLTESQSNSALGAPVGVIAVSGKEISGSTAFNVDPSALPIAGVVGFTVTNGSDVASNTNVAFLPSVLGSGGHDLFIGVSESFGANRPRVHIVPGSALQSAWGSTIDLYSAPPRWSVTIIAPSFDPGTTLGGEGFAFGIATIGDGDGDGVPDLAITAPRSDQSSNMSHFTEKGAVYIIPSNLIRAVSSTSGISGTEGIIDLDLIFD